ncbi:WD repeat-containing protein 18-like [Scomber scombrus]|uniref:WD repeat-containing protein 18-like n=1 Tax=Scomber scombrus TaxID=13677 RepID=UPI002DDB64AA|nr:WD repeat-containing protein 18-like [Scomber scombrus]
MAAPLQVIVSSDSGSQLWNSTVFDPHSGSSLLSYRGGNSAARSLCVLNGEYMLSAQLGKNFINVWEIQRKDQLQQKLVCPGVVTCLTTSPDGLFLAAGVSEAVYLWEVSTGKLLSVLSRHYQDVTCLKFTDDSSHFVSGAKDNLALVWSLCSVIQLDLNQTAEPRHILSRHSLPITDLHCGLMGAQARVATASLDQTVKVYNTCPVLQVYNTCPVLQVYNTCPVLQVYNICPVYRYITPVLGYRYITPVLGYRYITPVLCYRYITPEAESCLKSSE